VRNSVGKRENVRGGATGTLSTSSSCGRRGSRVHAGLLCLSLAGWGRGSVSVCFVSFAAIGPMAGVIIFSTRSQEIYTAAGLRSLPLRYFRNELSLEPLQSRGPLRGPFSPTVDRFYRTIILILSLSAGYEDAHSPLMG
jgi:hypothetical protein